jgi:hypothetical protein
MPTEAPVIGSPRSGIMVVTAALAILLLVMSGCVTSHPQSGAVESGPLAEHAVPLGAFLGSDAEGVRAVDGFAAALRVNPTVGHAYLPGHHWDDIEGSDWVLDPWTAWRRAAGDRMLVLNVPMLTPNEPPMADNRVRELLRQGAGGADDHHFRTLAQRLVARGGADTVIVLGWEMNGTTYSSRCEPDPLAWRQYWQRIVAVMRSVPGQRFRFDFTAARGPQAIEWTRCYPGDNVVDVIGMDSYDQHPGATFADFVYQPYGLRAHAEFAAKHRKPISYPEWGLYDYGDNASYVRAMYHWISTHNVAYQTITDYCPHGVWECRDNRAARLAYEQTFGNQRGDRQPGG